MNAQKREGAWYLTHLLEVHDDINLQRFIHAYGGQRSQPWPDKATLKLLNLPHSATIITLFPLQFSGLRRFYQVITEHGRGDIIIR